MASDIRPQGGGRGSCHLVRAPRGRNPLFSGNSGAFAVISHGGRPARESDQMRIGSSLAQREAGKEGRKEGGRAVSVSKGCMHLQHICLPTHWSRVPRQHCRFSKTCTHTLLAKNVFIGCEIKTISESRNLEPRFFSNFPN